MTKPQRKKPMAEPKSLTTPVNTTGMPPGIPFIIGNEAAERFCFYGMRTILVVFMTKYLLDPSGALAVMKPEAAKGWFHLFVSAVYFLPFFGAIIADALWGKYKTILYLSIIYCLGSFTLALDSTRLGLVAGLALIAIGSGGIKPCVSASVGDQFGPSNQHLLSKAFGWFYFSINFGSFFSTMLTPLLLAQVSRYDEKQMAPVSDKPPDILSKVGIAQRLNEQLPLSLTFTDDAGKQVQLASYFGKKPAILALVYYQRDLYTSSDSLTDSDFLKMIILDSEIMR